MNSDSRFGWAAVIAIVVYGLLLLGIMTPSTALESQASMQDLTLGLHLIGFMYIGFLPIPLTVFHVLRVRWLSVVMALAAGIFLFMAGNSILFAVLAGLGIYFISLAMAESLQSPGYPYSGMVVGTLILVMLSLVLLAMFRWSGIDIFHSFQLYLQQHAPQDPRIPKDTGTYIDGLRLMTPGLLCTVAFFQSVLTLLLCRAILGKGRVQMAPVLKSWQLPQTIVSIYVIALTFVLFHWGQNSPFWWQALNNMTYLAGFFIGVQGIAFIWRRIQHIHGKAVILIFMILALKFRLVGNIYIMLGLLELMNRTRRRT